jgi:hypothetical protein
MDEPIASNGRPRVRNLFLEKAPEESDRQRARLARMTIYHQRAALGLPLFDAASQKAANDLMAQEGDIPGPPHVACGDELQPCPRCGKLGKGTMCRTCRGLSLRGGNIDRERLDARRQELGMTWADLGRAAGCFEGAGLRTFVKGRAIDATAAALAAALGVRVAWLRGLE